MCRYNEKEADNAMLCLRHQEIRKIPSGTVKAERIF